MLDCVFIVFEFALEHDISLIHLGADLLPRKSKMIHLQETFIKYYLRSYFRKCDANGIKVLASFGNDDLYLNKKYFREFAFLLEEEPYHQGGYEFKAYNYVTDHCFGLKNGCKLEDENSRPAKIRLVSDFFNEDVIPRRRDVNEEKYFFIEDEDLDEYFKKKGTIEEDLKNITADQKTIMAIHDPPSCLNLDVTSRGERVGSQSVLKWIEREQPLLVLSGHIHESYKITKTWKANIGKTIVIQPGQLGEKTNFVLIEIEKDDIHLELIEKDS